MAIRMKDLKERALTILNEFKGQKMGIVGAGIILFIFLIGLLAPFLAPNANTEWYETIRWRDNPKGVPPEWADYLTSDKKAPKKVFEQPSSEEQEGDFVYLEYDYNNKYETPSQDIIVYVKGTAAQDATVTLFITLERPDTEGVEDDESIGIISTTIGSNGTFDERFSLLKSSQQKPTIYNFGSKFEDPETLPDQVNMDPAKVAFGKPNDHIISDPDILKGEYKIIVTLYGNNINLDTGEEGTRTILTGAKYGLMGTDNNGASITMAWVWGCRYALIIGVIVALCTVSIGTLFGMTSAYFGGWVDEIMQRINEIAIGIPTLPVMILVMFMWEQSIWVMVFLMAILYWRGIAKTIRARGLQIRQETYVEAAQSLGSGGGRIILNHMIPQILPYSVAEAALIVPLVIIAEAGLSVLGLGDPTIVTWGKLLSSAHTHQATIQGMWWWVLIPGFGITLLGFGFIASGMAIERVVNPKMRQR